MSPQESTREQLKSTRHSWKIAGLLTAWLIHSPPVGLTGGVPRILPATTRSFPQPPAAAMRPVCLSVLAATAALGWDRFTRFGELAIIIVYYSACRLVGSF